MLPEITDDQLDLEFAYVSYFNSCKDLFDPFYLCRRQLGHDGDHAAGFGEDRIRWGRSM
jgi:hypothetical protein